MFIQLCLNTFLYIIHISERMYKRVTTCLRAHTCRNAPMRTSCEGALKMCSEY